MVERVLFGPGGATELTQQDILDATLRYTVPASTAVTGPVDGQVIVPATAGQAIHLIRNAGHVDPALDQGTYPLVTIRLGSTIVYRDKLEAGLPWSETVSFLSAPGDALTIDVDQAATIYLNMRYQLA